MTLTLRKSHRLILLALLLTISGCSRETSKSVSGRVVKIADGDTLTILDSSDLQHKIRLKGIDAPERRQGFNEVSRQNLANLVFGKQVRVEYEKVDRYGRLVGTVWLDGDDECLEQVRAGLAWHFKKYENDQSPTEREAYAKAENEARAGKRGLWRDSNPTPPWEYRRHNTGSSDESDSPDEASSAPTIRNVSPLLKRSLTAPSSAGQTSPPSPVIDFQKPIGESGLIRGNKRSMIYHWPGCPNYDDIARHNRVPFKTREQAEKAGYRAARNCPKANHVGSVSESPLSDVPRCFEYLLSREV